MKKLLFLFLLLHSHVYTMDNPTVEHLYDALVNKVSSQFGQAHNRIFYFKVQNELDVYNALYNGTHDAIEQLIKTDNVNNYDFIFFDPRCNQEPKEIYKKFGTWWVKDDSHNVPVERGAWWLLAPPRGAN